MNLINTDKYENGTFQDSHIQFQNELSRQSSSTTNIKVQNERS